MTRPTDPRRPGKYAGDTNPETQRLRPPHSLTDREVEIARFLRCRWGWGFGRIAVRLHKPEPDVRLALRTLRTRRANPPRYAINVSPEAAMAFGAMKRPGEPAWATFNRLVGL